MAKRKRKAFKDDADRAARIRVYAAQIRGGRRPIACRLPAQSIEDWEQEIQEAQRLVEEMSDETDEDNA